MAVYYQDAYRIEKDDTLTGCRFGDCCLECPRERCKYESYDERAQRTKVDLMRKRYWRIRKRRRRGMTQQAIAIQLGITQQDVSYILTKYKFRAKVN